MKRPAGVVKIGDEVMKYLASNPALGLYYGSEEEISGHGEYDQLPIRRGRKTIEVHCDAAFAAASERSMSGVVVKYAGAPIFGCQCAKALWHYPQQRLNLELSLRDWWLEGH